MNDIDTIFYAFLGGVLPAILWLIFWLREDAKRPEPKGRLVQTFLAGMVSVLVVFYLQKDVFYFPYYGVIPFLVWAFLEELVKFLGAYSTGLRSKDDNEPIDPLIYMITAALGFVALENSLFILNPLTNLDLRLAEQSIPIALNTGASRFLGASLLHILASGAIGISLSLSFYKGRTAKIIYGLVGLLVATIIHTSFNSFVYHFFDTHSLVIFGSVWLGVALLLLVFEKIKTIAP